jgi:GAF domain-containing protein
MEGSVQDESSKGEVTGATGGQLEHVVFGLSVLALVYIVWTVSTASLGIPVLMGFPRIAVEITGVGVTALLVSASATLMFRLRSASQAEKERATHGLPTHSADAVPGASASFLKQGSLPLSCDDQVAVPVLIGTKAGVDYGEVGLGIATTFAAGLAHPSFDLGNFLTRTVELLAEQCAPNHSASSDGEAVHVTIHLVDEHGEWASLQAASSVSGKELVLRGHRLRRSHDTSVGWVMSERRVWRGSDGVHPSLTIPELIAMRSGIALPMMGSDARDMEGVLSLYSTEPDTYTDAEVSGLARIASYLGVAVSTVRQLQDVVAVSGNSDPFYKLANQLAAAGSEAAAYSAMFDVLKDYGPMRTIFVRTATASLPSGSDGLDVVIDTASSWSLRQAGASRHGFGRSLGDLIPPALIDIIIMGLALDHPLWVGDLGQCRSWNPSRPADRGSLGIESPELVSALRELAESSEAGALAFVPLPSGGTDLGSGPRRPGLAGGILILHDAAHQFSPLERHLHELLTDLGGVALERSRVLTEASMQLAREQQLAAIRERLRGSYDPDVILRTTVRELGRVLGAELTTVEMTAAPEPVPGSSDDIVIINEGS